MIGNKTEKEGRNMINPVTPNQVINEVQTPEVEKNRQYVSMRGNKLERISPDGDSFESENKNKTGKTIGIIGGLLATAVIVTGLICLHKGGKVLEGENASLKEKIKAGWKDLRGKGTEVVAEVQKTKLEELGKKDVNKWSTSDWEYLVKQAVPDAGPGTNVLSMNLPNGKQIFTVTIMDNEGHLMKQKQFTIDGLLKDLKPESSENNEYNVQKIIDEIKKLFYSNK